MTATTHVRRAALLGFFLSVGVQAQVPAQAPAANTNLQNTLPRPPLGQEPQTQPRSRAQVQRPAPAQGALDQMPVQLKEVRVAGVKTLPFSEVSAVFKPLLDTGTTAGALVRAADEVTALYNSRGYAISYAYVPVQDFSSGVVQVVVVEGYVDRLAITGAPADVEAAVRRVAGRVVNERPLKRETFERYVSLVGRLAGVGVDANVPVPQTADGATELQLAIRHKRVAGTLALDLNHPGVEGILTGTVNGIAMGADSASVSYMAPRGDFDRSYASLDYVLPLGTDGLSLRLNGYRYQARPQGFTLGGPLPQRDYSEERAGFSFAYPALLRADKSVWLDAGAYASRSGDVFTQPGTPGEFDTRASVRALQGGVTGNWAAKGATSELGLNVAKGSDGHGAGQAVNFVDLDFTRVKLNGRRSDEWMGGKMTTFITFAAQQSRDRLPATERISFGGNYFGAAYPSGEINGDRGAAIAAELGRPFRLDSRYVQRIEPFIGVDRARVRVSQSAFHQPGIGSAIAGVRFSRPNVFAVQLVAAKPTGARPIGETGKPVRWNLQTSVSF